MTEQVCESVTQQCLESYPDCPHNRPHPWVEEGDASERCHGVTCPEVGRCSVHCVPVETADELDATRTAQVAELVKAAREIEWVCINGALGYYTDVCPHCWQKKPNHADGCGLHAALAPFAEVES